MKRNRKIALIIAGILILFCAVTYLVTPLVIVRPSYNREAAEELTLIELEEMFAEKRPLNLPLVEDIRIETKNGNLYGWRLHQSGNPGNSAPNLLLYFGGYDEDSATAALRFLQQMTETDYFSDFDIAVVDWPGFGTSEGRAGDDAIREASVSIYNYFHTRDNVQDIYVMGYSFGAGPATYVASRYEVSGLILLAPYESAFDLYNSVTPVFYGPMKLLISFRMDADIYAETVECAPLLIASLSDKRIPFRHAQALSEHFPSGCELVALEGPAHGELLADKKTLESISGYLH